MEGKADDVSAYPLKYLTQTACNGPVCHGERLRGIRSSCFVKYARWRVVTCQILVDVLFSIRLLLVEVFLFSIVASLWICRLFCSSQKIGPTQRAHQILI